MMDMDILSDLCFSDFHNVNWIDMVCTSGMRILPLLTYTCSYQKSQLKNVKFHFVNKPTLHTLRIKYQLWDSWLLQLAVNTGRELLTCPEPPRAACAVYIWNSHGYVTLTFREFEVGHFSALKEIFISNFSLSVTCELLFVIMTGA